MQPEALPVRGDARDQRGPVGAQLLAIYDRLLGAFGPQGWWPADSPFEVCVGAILTQNTSWANVRQAVENLKQGNLLSPLALGELPREVLAQFIRPAGYYNIKAARLQNFVAFLLEVFRGDLDAMFSGRCEDLREQLLTVRGIGPETADSILLYAGHKPTFVVDAYTVRALRRHDLINDDADYEEVRAFFLDHLPSDVALFNEYHALWVMLGKRYCRKGSPMCPACPLEGL